MFKRGHNVTSTFVDALCEKINCLSDSLVNDYHKTWEKKTFVTRL